MAFVWVGGAFAQTYVPLKDWGELNPGGEPGLHTPAVVSYAGSGAAGATFSLTLGAEEHGLGTWTSFVLYRTDTGDPPERSVGIWPLQELPGVYRPVGLALAPDQDYRVDAYALTHIESPDHEYIRAVTLYMAHYPEDGFRLHWTREFDRQTDEAGDNVPVGILFHHQSDPLPRLVVVMVACYDEQGLHADIGINVYHYWDGTLMGAEVLHMEESVVPIGIISLENALFVGGTARHPLTGAESFVIAGFDINTGEVLEAWDPREPRNYDWTWITLPGYDLEAVRIFKAHASNPFIHMTGNAVPVTGGDSNIFTVSIDTTHEQEEVRWADLYDSGGHDVVSDMTSFSDTDSQSPTGRVWIVGTSTNQQGSTLRVIQYDEFENTQPGTPYNIPWMRWEAEWDREGAGATGLRICNIREAFSDALAGVRPELPYPVLVAGLAASEEPSGDPEYVVLLFDDNVAASKDPEWFHFDAAPPGSLNAKPVVGIDGRWKSRDGQYEHWRIHWWFSARAADELEPQVGHWYTAQWYEEVFP